MEDLPLVKKYLKTILKTQKTDNQKTERDEVQKNKDPNSLHKITLMPGQVPPSKLYIPVLNQSHVVQQPTKKWIQRQIIFHQNPAEQTLDPKLESWIEIENEKKPAYFTKYNVPFKMPSIARSDITLWAQSNPSFWTYEEIVHLFSLLELFEGNFHAVYDRYAETSEFQQRSIEDIKEQTFSVLKFSIESKNVEKSIEFKQMNYNKSFDKLRKMRTEKFYNRTEDMSKQEEFMINEIKSLELVIKKKEKENANFKKLIEMTKEEKIEFDEKLTPKMDNGFFSDAEFSTQPIVYSRSSLIKGPIHHLPPLTNKKLELAMKELEIPVNIYGTENNIKLFEQLRISMLKLFYLNAKYQQEEKTLKKLIENKKTKAQNLEDSKIAKDQNSENRIQVYEFKAEGICLKRIKEE